MSSLTNYSRSMSVVKRQKVDDSLIVHDNKDVHRKGKVLYDNAVALEGHEGAVLTSRFNTSGTSLATGGMDKQILLWNLPTESEDQEYNYGVLKGHKGAVTRVQYQDTVLVSASADSTLGIWDCETGARIRKCTGHELVINDVSMRDETSFVSACDDGISHIWDVREKRPVGTIKSDFPILACTINSRRTSFYLAGIDPTIRCYDFRKLDTANWSVEGQVDSVSSLSLHHDHSLLVSRSLKGIVKTFNAKDFVPKGMSRANPFMYDGAPSGKENYLIRACFNPSSTLILSGSEDKTTTVWSYATRKMQNKYDGHNGTVIDVDHHPLLAVIASSSTDGTVILREI